MLQIFCFRQELLTLCYHYLLCKQRKEQKNCILGTFASTLSKLKGTYFELMREPILGLTFWAKGKKWWILLVQ